MVERIFGQYIYDLEEDLISVMEEAIQSGEILAERSASKLASLFLSSYYGLRVMNSATMNRELADRIVESTLDAIFSRV